MRTSWVLAAVAISAAPLAAPAQTTTALPAFELERLEADPSATGALLVGNGELLSPRAYRASLFGHFERNPLLLRVDESRVGAVVANRS